MSKINVDVIGVHTEKSAEKFIKNFEGLLKSLNGDKSLKFKVSVQVYCADCGAKFKTFAQLRKHMKATGHKDIPKRVV
jgi:hypothetical protein